MNPSIDTQTVPVLDLTPEIGDLWDEVQAALLAVVRSGKFIMGPDVAAFEEEAAAFLGARHAVGVNSGTDALVISLRALGIGPGDEVITTPFSFFATAEAVSVVGATPVFVDIELDSLDLDPTLVEAAVTPRTKALLPVHLFGRACDMDALTAVADAHGLRIVEDCAQAFGGRVGGRAGGRRTGTIGDVGAYSFFPTKNLGAFGDAGLIATDDDDLAEAARMLRVHGSKQKYRNEMIGYNSRLDSLQAAVLRVKLPHVDRRNELRRAVASRYNELLSDVPGVITPEVVDGHVFHQYTVRLQGADRDAVQAAMKARGVGTMVYYPVPQDRLPAYAGRHPRNPVSDLAATQVLSLPIWPEMAPEAQERVVSVLSEALA